MRAMRRGSSTVVMCALIVWGQILPSAEEVPRDYSVKILRGEEEEAPQDDSVKVTWSVSTLFNCKTQSTPVNVRIQEFKTTSGLTFRRKAVSSNFIICLEEKNYKNLSATNLFMCGQETEKSGLKMFKFERGACTGYPVGISQELQGCVGRGTVVVYTISGVSGGVSVVSKTLNATTSDITWTWRTEGLLCYVDSYRVTMDGNRKIVTSLRATFDSLLACTNYNLTVTPLNGNGKEIGPALETTMATLPDYVLRSQVIVTVPRIYTVGSGTDLCQIVDHNEVEFLTETGNLVNNLSETEVKGLDVCRVSKVSFFTVFKNGTRKAQGTRLLNGWLSYTLQLSGSYFYHWVAENACMMVDPGGATMNDVRATCAMMNGILYGRGFNESLGVFNNFPYWVNLLKIEGKWMWGNGNQEPDDSVNWHSNGDHLLDKGSPCAVYSNGKLIVATCSEKKPYFCVNYL